MHWLFIFAAMIMFAVFIATLVTVAYQEWDIFPGVFLTMLFIEGALSLIAWLLWMGLKEYAGS